MTGLVIDLFAGGGGASEGIRMALGRDPDYAVNHDPLAVAMHKANHPGTVHYTQDVWEVSPRQVTRGRPVDLLWASPDCTHFSKAKGGAPRRDQKRRDLAWVVEKWAREARPGVIYLENVEEFRTWGPLDREGRPIEAARGETFRAWVRSLRRLGYAVQFKELRASGYGTPTIRKRLYMIARCDGLPIVWPEPTHGPGRPQPWRTAAECIDWSIPCPSIFERKRPLAENTLHRAAEGIQRYVLGKAEPFIVTYYGPKKPGDFRGCGMGGQFGTQTTENRHALVVPYLTEHAHSKKPRTFDVEDPLRTHCANVKGGHFALVSPVLVGAGGPSYGGKPVGADKPFGTLMTENHQALVTASLVQTGYGERAGQAPRALDIGKPLGTVVAGGCKHALVASHLVKLRGTCKAGQPVDEPVATVTAGGLHLGEVRAFMVNYHGQSIGQGMDSPTTTLTSRDRLGLVTCTVGDRRREVEDLLRWHRRSKFRWGFQCDDFDGLIEDAFCGEVVIRGEVYCIADIGMRMLQPRELYRAQGFPDSYVIDLEHEGRALSKSDQVRLCGNSVCPPMAEALVRANYASGLRQERDPLPLLAMGGGK